MKKKTWKRCVCMIGVVLFAVTGLNANNRVPDSPIKKTRSNTFIIEKEKALSLQLIDKRSEIYFKKVKRDE